MFNSKQPSLDDLPTHKQLLRSTVIAFISAIFLLITVVMPAEFAIDITGAGRLLGLTQVGEVKAQIKAEQEPEDALKSDSEIASSSAPDQVVKPKTPESVPVVPVTVIDTPVSSSDNSSLAIRRDQQVVELKPNQGAEVKMQMKKGQKVKYYWTANGGKVNYDTHGDPINAPKGFYHGYGKGRSIGDDSGTLIAEFDGKHGWFWRNRSDKTVTITLKTQGEYANIKRVL